MSSIEELLKKLEEKYSQTGQNLASNLEGLLYNDYLKYWDYIQVETLLTLQKPRTSIPDEVIFITYHQITELYFKLILWEMEQIAEQKHIVGDFFLEKIQRINRYLKILVESFEVVSIGMAAEQFRKFRMALLPASGFQSAQYRFIEIAATDFLHLATQEFIQKADHHTLTLSDIYNHIYWKKGATETDTGKKTITLEHFEQQYSQEIVQRAEAYQDKNIWKKYQEINPEDEHQAQIIEALKNLDYLFNVEWALSHLKSAVRYLREKGQAIDATGGTNWTKYLPPNFQKVVFYPSLWSQQERAEWGRKKVEDLFHN